MADALGAGLQLPGSDPKSLMQQIMAQAKKSDADATTATADLGASRDREAAARAAQVAAQQPARDKLKATLADAPATPETQALPETPTAPTVNTKEMGDTLGLITALAAIGGALTRQPLTAALNSFAAGVHGYVQGKQQVFEDNLKVFDRNLKKANSENETVWKKYQAAREKHGADIQGLVLEIQQIAAETQSPIDMELAKQGRIVDLMKLAETRNNNYTKALEMTAKIGDSIQQHRDAAAARAEAAKDRRAIAEQASADRNALLDERIRHDKETEKTAASKATVGGGAQNRMQRVMAIDVDNAEYNLGRLVDMSQKKGELIGGSPVFANHFGGSWTADFKRYLETGAVPEDLQGADALLMNLAFDIASGQSGGSGQLAQAKIAELEKQMPLDSMPPEVKEERWRALFHRVKAINSQLPPASQKDLSAYEGALGAPGAPAAGKPQPTAQDRAWAKAHPEDAPKFKAHFGVEP